MDEERRGWPWWKKLLAALAVCLFTLLCLFFGLRRPWIEPLPGVRVEPTRPVMARSDFGPESPYLRLVNLLVDLAESDIASRQTPTLLDRELLAIVGRPPPPPAEFFGSPESVAKKPSWWWPGMPREFTSGNAELVLQKLHHHPWPDMPPPPAPVPEPLYALPSATLDEEDPFFQEGGRLKTKGIFHVRDRFVGGETFGERDYFGDQGGRTDGGDIFSGWKYSLGMQEEGTPGKPLLDARTGEPIYRLPHAAFAEDAPWNLEQCRDVRRILELHEPFFPALDAILADPAARMPTVDRYDMPLPELSLIRTLCSWLAVAAQVKAASGDWEGAFLCIGRILQLADMGCRGAASHINHFVQINVQAAMEAAWLISCRYPVPVPVLKQAARDILAHADTAEPYVEAVRTDWLAHMSLVHESYRYGQFRLIDGRRLWLGGGPGEPIHWFTRSTFVILTPLMGSTPEASTRNLHAYYQHLVVLAEQPYSARTAAEYDTLRARLIPDSLVAFWLGSRDPVGRALVLLLFPGRNPRAPRAVHHASLHGMALFLALRAYELEHGGVPDALDALVPDYLPRVPEDPFDGQPFRYLPRAVPGLPPEAWAVYSIGEDFADDGGTSRVVFGYSRDMPDLVFPSQPYPPMPGR